MFCVGAGFRMGGEFCVSVELRMGSPLCCYDYGNLHIRLIHLTGFPGARFLEKNKPEYLVLVGMCGWWGAFILSKKATVVVV